MAWKTEGVCSTKAGSLLGNTRKNRYKDVVPCKSVGVLGEPVPRAQMLGGSVHLATPTHSQPLSPISTPPLPKACYRPCLRWLHYSLKPQGGRSPLVCCHPACVCLGGRQRLDTHSSIHMSHPLADDETRVILSLLQEEGHGDYINANFIRVRLVIREGVALGWVGTGFRILLMNGPFPGHRWKPGLHCDARTPASHSVGLLAPALGV